MTTDARQRRKAALDRQIKACRACAGRQPGITESAPGFGSLYSPVAIVGEALCRACMDRQEPFYGGSGRVLDRCFERAKVAKTDLFITNSIHCHPPGIGTQSPRRPTTARTSCARAARDRRAAPGDRRRQVREGSPAAAVPGGTGAGLAVSNPGCTVRPTGPPHLLFPPHPYWIMTRPAPLREQYMTSFASAIEWGFSTGPAQPIN